MNIFKILASGSGRLYEPNVSAFLGYLLNPKEDHGLGDAFLKKFLEPLLKKNDNLKYMNVGNLSIRSNFDFEVLLEQAFKSNNDSNDNVDNADETENEKNRIVDIVILCYEKESQQGMFLAENIINQKREGQKSPTHIFLIENKIKDSSVDKGQLGTQYKQTIQKLEDMGIDNPQKLVSVIFVTPEGKNAKDEFENFKETNYKYHLFWSKKGDGHSTLTKNDTSISKIIKDIIKEESHPIDVYCKYTLQAFLEFIESDFQSTIMEEMVEKKREFPRFIYRGEKYSRPQLAKKLIFDYIDKYEKENKRKITFDELKSELFPEKKEKKSSKNDPITDDPKKADFREDGTKIRDYFGYYNHSKEIAEGKKIYVRNGWSDEELQRLLDKTNCKLDDI